jgi:hypothetical protein
MRRADKRKIEMGEIVALDSGSFEHETKSGVEVFGPIFPLIRDTRRIVHHDIKDPIVKWQMQIVAHRVWTIARIDIQPNHGTPTASPKPSAIDRGV